ncbi:LOW QUALITY PROTEIN: RAP1GDS1 isoform 21, partial [Pan troglodytes]
NDSLQAQLINMGVIPTLVKLLGIHCQNAALTEMCLVAFGNLAELGCTGSVVPASASGEGLRKLTIMAEGEEGAGVSPGETGSERERQRGGHRLLTRSHMN